MNISYKTEAKRTLAQFGEGIRFTAAPSKGNNHGITIIDLATGGRRQVMHSRKRRQIGALIKTIARVW